MTKIETDPEELGRRIVRYCRNNSIPVEYFFQIINDQKVAPMLRGKGMEYNAYLVLKQKLNPDEWTVEKLNLSAQPGSPDQDIGITHRRTGIRLTAESKSAVRGSMNSGEHARQVRVPHFNVKCHRSRSNIKLAGTTNDRYSIDAFDVLMTNPSNAIFARRTIGEQLELIGDEALLKALFTHYRISNNQELIVAASEDWRFALPPEIADAKGFIPRTPTVYLVGDPHWQTLEQLEVGLMDIVRQRRAAGNRRAHN